MKKLLFILSLLQLTFAEAQTELKIFSEKGDAFTLVIDGEKQNLSPEYKIENVYLKKGKHQVKAIFEDFTKKDADLKINLKEEGVYTYKISTTEKSEHKIELLNFRNEKVEPIVASGNFKGYSKQKLKDYLSDHITSNLSYTVDGLKINRNYDIIFSDLDQVEFKIKEYNITNNKTTFEYQTQKIFIKDLFVNSKVQDVFGKNDVSNNAIVYIILKIKNDKKFIEKVNKEASEDLSWPIGTRETENISKKRDEVIEAFRELIKLSNY